VDCAHITRRIGRLSQRLTPLADHRAELIAEATPIVERWQAEGFFGRRARLK
jgi:hypothetical protein